MRVSFLRDTLCCCRDIVDYHRIKRYGGLNTMKNIIRTTVVIMVVFLMSTSDYTINSHERANFIEDVQVECDIPLVH